MLDHRQQQNIKQNEKAMQSTIDGLRWKCVMVHDHLCWLSATAMVCGGVCGSFWIRGCCT